MTSLKNADTTRNPANIEVRIFGPQEFQRWAALLLILLCGWPLAGCGSRDTASQGGGPPATAPAREPLPPVPQQSEPEVPGTSEPVGAEAIAPSDDGASTSKPSSEEPASDEPEVDESSSDPPGKSPSGCDVAVDEETPPAGAEPPGNEETTRYEFRDVHDPNGIGKFYMGREIAHVMGYPAAPWLERPEREKEEATSKLFKALAIKEGMVVGDIGAGSGVLTLPISGRVGRKGKVFAVDVQQEMLDRLAGKLKSRKIENVVLVLGTDKTPRLESESLDLALMVDVYHEFAFPYEMLLEISRAMKPGGRVVFVEFRMEDPRVPIKLVHKMTEAQVKKEVDFPEYGLKWKETIGTLPWQHVIVFEKQAETANADEK